MFDVSSVTAAPATATLALWPDHQYTIPIGDIVAVKATGFTIGTDFVVADFNNLTGWNSTFDDEDLTAYSAVVDDWDDGTSANDARFGSHTNLAGMTEARYYENDGVNYNKITLNAAALSDIASLDTLAIAILNANYDYTNTEPAVQTRIDNLWFNTSDHPGHNSEYYPGNYNFRHPVLVYTELGYSGKRDEGRGEVGDLSAAVGNRDLYPTKQGVVAEPDFTLNHYGLEHVDANFSITDTTIANPRQAPFSKRFQLIRTLGSGKTTQG